MTTEVLKKIRFGFTILFFLTSLVVHGQEPVAKLTSLDVILLIDNSRSTKSTDRENLRLKAARSLLEFLDVNVIRKGGICRLGMANFGEKLGTEISLRRLSSALVLDSLRSEKFDFTDFRHPLEFALREFKAKSFGSKNRTAVVFFTDGNPRLPQKELSDAEKVLYFMGDAIKGDTSKLRMDRLVQELQFSGAKLFVIAVGDTSTDAKLWQMLIPSNQYHSITRATDLAELYHSLFAGLIGIDAAQVVAPKDSQHKNFEQGNNEKTIAVRVQSFLKDNWKLLLAALILLLISGYSVYAITKTTIQNDTEYLYNTLNSENEGLKKRREREKRNWESKFDEMESNKNELEEKIEALRKEKESYDKAQSLQPEEMELIVSAEKSWQEALKFIREKKTEKAKSELQNALDKYLNFSNRAIAMASRKISQILSIMLNEIYKGSLEDQRKLIYDQASAQATDAQIQALAQVLPERWALEPDIMITEFYDLRRLPKGQEVMKRISAIGKDEKSSEKDEKIMVQRRAFIYQLINTVTHFGESMESIV